MAKRLQPPALGDVASRDSSGLPHPHQAGRGARHAGGRGGDRPAAAQRPGGVPLPPAHRARCAAALAAPVCRCSCHVLACQRICVSATLIMPWLTRLLRDLTCTLRTPNPFFPARPRRLPNPLPGPRRRARARAAVAAAAGHLEPRALRVVQGASRYLQRRLGIARHAHWVRGAAFNAGPRALIPTIAVTRPAALTCSPPV